MWRTVIRYDRIRKNGVTLIYVFLYLPFVANLRIPSESRIFSIDLNLALYFLSDAMNIAHAGALAAHLVGRCITYSACSRGMMQGHSRYVAQSSLANSV